LVRAVGGVHRRLRRYSSRHKRLVPDWVGRVVTERWPDDKLIDELLRRDDMVSWQAAKRLEELLKQVKERADADPSDIKPSD
jgi:polyhydroxyalkanoate synthesis regulator phasin